MTQRENSDIYEILKNEILHLTLLPGECISEVTLSERFHVSRTPIRAVLQKLSGIGLLEIQAKKKTKVTKINYALVNEIIYQRIAVESFVIRDFIKSCSPLDIEKIRQSVEELKGLFQHKKEDANFPENFRTLDLKMHEIWFLQTGHTYLWETLRKEHPDYSRFCMLDILGSDNYTDIIGEHEQLLYIIEHRKHDEIEELLKSHLYGGIKRLSTKVFCEYKDYFI